MEIVSTVSGRVRIRDARLKKVPVATLVEEILSACTAITGTETNCRVGSVLVRFDTDREDAAAIAKLVADALDVAAASALDGVRQCARFPVRCLPTNLPRLKRAAVNGGLSGSLLVSAAAAMLHLKSLHVVSGWLFLGLAGFHGYEQRNRFWR